MRACFGSSRASKTKQALTPALFLYRERGKAECCVSSIGLTERDEHFPTWWMFLPVHTTALTGWSGGPAAARLAGRGEGAIVEVACNTLARLFDVSRARVGELLERAHVADWQTDPFARGAYSYVPVGGVGATKRLAEPVDDTLFFAGEATHEGMSGTVAGAIASGYRSAREILQNHSIS